MSMLSGRSAALALLLALTGCGGSTSSPYDPLPTDQGVDPGGDLDQGLMADADVDAERHDLMYPDFSVVDAASDAQIEDAGPPDAAVDPCPALALEPGAWRRPLDTPDRVEGESEHHSAVEPIINPGDGFHLDGKFAYGLTSRDLEGEVVQAWLRHGECGEWAQVGQAITDSDGRVSIALDHPDPPLEVGPNDFALVVRGDASRTFGSVWVVPEGKQAVVFDIDGTLTVGDSEIFQEVLLGHVPEMYEGAPSVVNHYADLGYQIIFVTGRPYMLNKISRAWLQDMGVAKGPVRTVDSVLDTLPTDGRVGRFKTEYLQHLIDAPGLDFVAAYGNATTDICAYARVGIDPNKTFIIGPHGGEGCDDFAPTQSTGSYPAHRATLDNLAPANP